MPPQQTQQTRNAFVIPSRTFAQSFAKAHPPKAGYPWASTPVTGQLAGQKEAAKRAALSKAQI